MSRGLVLMGVAGSGKSGVGRALARQLGWFFLEGDARHPEANRQRMARGQPLREEDRDPWIAALRSEIAQRLEGGQSLVVACSALRRAHRDRLRAANPGVRFVHLRAAPEILRQRLQARPEHFFGPALLESQLATLEPPGPGEDIPEISTEGPVAETVAALLGTLALPVPAHPTLAPQGPLGVVGLGAMGAAFAERLAGFGVRIVGCDADADRLAAAAERVPGLVPASDLGALVAALPPPRTLLLLLPAGPPVDAVLHGLEPLLWADDLVIDAGNAHPDHTRWRARRLAQRGIHYMGLGLSGGPDGARLGPALMAGSTGEAWAQVAPVLTAVAARARDGAPCATWVGPEGAGHFAKMVHNGIEYAEMQLLAEAWDLLHRGFGAPHDAVAATFSRWQTGPRRSFLLGRTADVLRTRDEDGAPLMDRVRDQVGANGTGRWTVEAALPLGVPVPTIAAAVTARLLSAPRPERERLRGQELRATEWATLPEAEDPFEVVGAALQAARWMAHAEGFHLLAAAGLAEAWPLALDELARAWRAGCILHSALLETLAEVYAAEPTLPSPLLDPSIQARLHALEPDWRVVVALGARTGLPLPATSAALHAWDALHATRQPAGLLQALRDAFGHHGFERTDAPPGTRSHHPWRGEER